MPSLVYWREGTGAARTGRLVLGQEADELSGLAPWCLERTPKRRIGDEFMRLGEKELRVVDVVGAILRKVAEEAISLRGGELPGELRLTHPARWGHHRLEKLRQAAEVAGFGSPVFVPEPVAAATHFASERLSAGQHVAVYDLGGGTFDTAVLRRTEDSFELVGAPGGDENLGGEDFDDRLYRYLGRQLARDKWQALRESTDRPWTQANRELLRNARKTKEFLSRGAQYEFYMPPPIDQELLASAESFRELIIGDVEATVGELERTIRGAGVEPTQLTAIYLAGGSSRIPLIGRMIQQRLGQLPESLDDPKVVTVLGAARPPTVGTALRKPTPEQISDTQPTVTGLAEPTAISARPPAARDETEIVSPHERRAWRPAPRGDSGRQAARTSGHRSADEGGATTGTRPALLAGGAAVVDMGFAPDRTLADPSVQALAGGRRPRAHVALIAVCAALGVAAVAVAAVILLSGGLGASTASPTSSYSQQLAKLLAPLIGANQTLSSALTSLDGSQPSISTAKIDTSQALTALDAAHGAVAVLAAPSSQSTLSAQVQQALTADSGYLQAVSSTLATPNGTSTGQLQTLATGAQSALDPLATVASGAGTSVSGTGNLVSWAQSASGQAQNQQSATQQQTTQQGTSTVVPQATPTTPSGSAQGLTACGQNISVNSSTSCAFANNVFAQYANAVQQASGPLSTDVTATSPVTGATYTDNCQYNSSTQIVLCSHGSDLIQFPESAAAVYNG